MGGVVVTPTPEVVSALVALPEPVRLRLEEHSPGWLCSSEWADPRNPRAPIREAVTTLHASTERTYDTTGRIGGGDVLDSVRRDGRPIAWLPADSAALLTVATTLGANRPTLRLTPDGWFADAANVTPEDEPVASAHLAALRLLGAVAR